MTLLPILERELRIRARSRANYWGRFGVGLLGAIIALPPLLWSGPGQNPAEVARGLFTGIVAAGFLLSCAACLVTADSISAERREGTLGLLLLTRVKTFDVLLGKFASSGTTCLLALAAFLPVLMIPILAGGVSGGEVVRRGVVLLNTVFLALSAGLWASAGASERFRAHRAALFLVAGLVLLPCLVPGMDLKYASPLGGMTYADPGSYQLGPWRFWLSFCLVHLLGWSLLWAAVLRLRKYLHSGEDGTGSESAAIASNQVQPRRRQVDNGELDIEPVAKELAEELPSSPTARPRHSSFKSSSGGSPLCWLLHRQRGIKASIWCGAVVSCLHYMFPYAFRFAGMGSPVVYMGVTYAMSFIIAGVSGSLFAWAASRFFVEARRNRELELLLTTPLGAQALVSTQWRVLKRLLRWPVVLMLGPMLLQGVTFLSLGTPGWVASYALVVVLDAITTVVRIGVLCRLGMWFGLRGEGQARAILWTVGLGQIFPYVLGLVCILVSRTILSVLGDTHTEGGWFVSALGPQLLILFFLIWLFCLASRRALQEVSEARPLSLRELVTETFVRSRTAVQRARRWQPR